MLVGLCGIVLSQLTALYGTAPWVETSCLVSLRTRACMLGYSATGTISDGHGYCKSSCEAQLAICAGFNDLIGMDPLSQLGLSCEMAVDEPDCHTGGVSQVEEQSPVCPHPLVKPDSASHERDAHVEMIDGTACAMPCPNTLRYVLQTMQNNIRFTNGRVEDLIRLLRLLE